MASEYVQVLDTAVKIGMGALISGVCTYWVTKLNHSAEAAREFQARRLEIIDKAAAHVDEYTKGLSNLLGAIDGCQRTHPTWKTLDPKDPDAAKVFEFLKQSDDNFTKTWDHGSFAVSKLQLLGIAAAIANVDSLKQLANEVRLKVFFSGEIPSQETLSEWREKVRGFKLALFEELAKNYRPSAS